MPCCRRNGFTLIEMLIAMTLLGIMVVLLFSSLKIAAESWNAGEGKIMEVNRKAVVYQFFKRHLTTIRPMGIQASTQQQTPESNDESLEPPTFLGQSQIMRFVAALPASSARKGLQIFEIVADKAKPSTLIVKLSPYQTDQEETIEPAVLLEHVKAFNFTYFGKKEEGGEAGWTDDWSNADRLPRLIKVDIALEDGSDWPAMIFPLKITELFEANVAGADNGEPASQR